MKVLHIASEAVPFAKTGGLADVAGTLPKELSAQNVESALILPLYNDVRQSTKDLVSTGIELSVPVGDTPRTGMLWRGKIPGSNVPAYFIQRDEYFGRQGIYGSGREDYPDNSERYVFFCRAALEAVRALALKFDVVHVHDWQTALVPVYLKTTYAKDKVLQGAKSVLTIHNISYQGVFWHWDMKLTGLEWSLFNWKQLEFYGKVNFLKGGLVFADAITTVSETYAREIQTLEFGCGLDGVLSDRAKDLTGILNGVDYAVWSPENDPHIAVKYSAAKPAGKEKCKSQLQRKCGLPEDAKAPLVGMITRLVDQKGIDLVAAAMDGLLNEGVQIVLLGTGEDRYHKIFGDIAARHKGRVSVFLVFNNALAHEIEAGSDMLLMPSRYEPCGLNQIYSLRYGTIPIVRKTGGLADTVIDASPEGAENGMSTGFVFREATPEAMLAAVKRAVTWFRRPKDWAKLVRNAMKQDWSWARSAAAYARLYQQLVKR